MSTACIVYLNLRHVRFCSLAFQIITRASGVNFRALFTHPQTKHRALNTAPTPPNPSKKPPKMRLCGSQSDIQLGMSAWAMHKRGAQNYVCSSNNFPGVYGLNSTSSTDNIRFKLRSNHPGWRLTACFSALLQLGGTRVSSCLTWWEGSVLLTSLCLT
jgi:hypothetical protein